jgi:beta-glucanase (GH16 family)
VRWRASSHALGRGRFDPGNVRIQADVLDISLNAADFSGGEAVSTELHGAGRFSAELRTPGATGSLSAFFLYERNAPHADEIDIEILNDGSRIVLFTVWSAGREIAHTRHVLPFDPADDFHEYAIVREEAAIRFVVDGVELCACTGDELPRAPLDMRISAWWPAWLVPSPGAGGELTARRVRTG